MKLPRPEMKKGRVEIIPMIDAIFFLLVYFIMMSLSMVQMESHDVKLPESVTAQLKSGDKIVVSITKEGQLYLDRDAVTEKDIIVVLTERLNERPDTAVIINCDKDRQLAQFTRVLDIVKQANAKTVMIATTPVMRGVAP